ncbi:MAG: hypothetical protein II920_07480 [Clostridia bacterium]|nr:hypothetical protein [Clostridia bacterium]
MKKRRNALSVTGTIIALIGLLAAPLTGFIAGTTGAIICTVIAGVGALLAVISLAKGGKGIGAVVMAVIAILLAFSLASAANGFIETVHSKAVELGNAPLVEKYMAPNKLGFVGCVLRIPNDDADLDAGESVINQFVEQIQLVNDAMKDENAAAADPAVETTETIAPQGE